MEKSVKNSGTEKTDISYGRRVLIVDDDNDFGAGLADLLTLEGCTVKLANSVDAALKLLESFPAEVALIDIRLGQGSGIDLAARLQSGYPELLSVMMTAYAGIDTAVEALRQGAYDYLRKPFHSEDLLATLKRCFERIDIILEKDLAEEALRRSQKMEAIGRLSGGIAHDFNNQLGIIIGYLDLLKDYAGNDEKPGQWVDTAARATMRCTDLTRQLLALSRHRKKKETALNLNSTLKEVETMIKRSVTPEVEVHYFLTDDLWLTEIDSGEFQDAILNIVINARDAMPGGGRLLIETTNKHLDANYANINSIGKPGDYVQLILSDTGTGMDKETLKHVFDPFFTTKPEGKGTGLGMAMVYGFAKRYGGYIKIYSEPDVGTTIRMYLPRSAADKADTPADSSQVAELSTGSESILIVDDEIGLLTLADEYLTDLGYRTRTAENAAQALEILKKDDEIDLLFSDVVMPGGINGYKLAQQATELRPDIKVLLTSGFTLKTVDQSGLHQFFTHLLNKPYRKSDLAQQVRFLLDKNLKPVKTLSNPDSTKENFVGLTTILVVDDKADVRDLFKLNLERLDYKTVLAGNGDEAIAIYRQSLQSGEPIGAVILDLTFTGSMGGKEIADKIRTLNPQAKIIVSSGYTESPEMTHYQDYGFNGALEKNFNRENIKQVIEQVLSTG